MAVGVEGDGAPTEYVLHRPFPNPVGALTGARAAVRYDALGRLVAVLADEECPAGRHAVAWEPGRLASGLYFVRMEAGSFAQSQKVLVAR